MCLLCIGRSRGVAKIGRQFAVGVWDRRSWSGRRGQHCVGLVRPCSAGKRQEQKGASFWWYFISAQLSKHNGKTVLFFFKRVFTEAAVRMLLSSWELPLGIEYYVYRCILPSPYSAFVAIIFYYYALLYLHFPSVYWYLSVCVLPLTATLPNASFNNGVVTYQTCESKSLSMLVFWGSPLTGIDNRFLTRWKYRSANVQCRLGVERRT